MSPEDALRELGRPTSWGEALESFKARHGKSTTRVLAGMFGTTMRSVQRWFKSGGTAKLSPARIAQIMGAADSDLVAAQALRTARTVTVGRVQVTVKSTGKPDGTRPVGTLVVDPTLAADLKATATQLTPGGAAARAGAADTLSDALLGAYSAKSGDNRRIAPGALMISDYPGGITVG